MDPAVARQHEAWEDARSQTDESFRALRIMIGNDEVFSLVEEMAMACCVAGYRDGFGDACGDLLRLSEMQT